MLLISAARTVGLHLLRWEWLSGRAGGVRKPVFFSIKPMGQTISDDNGIGRYAQGRVVMEAAPDSSLEIVQAKQPVLVSFLGTL